MAFKREIQIISAQNGEVTTFSPGIGCSKPPIIIVHDNASSHFIVSHPADKIDLGSKNCYSLVTYTHELPMGPASQNRFWLFHICPSGENSDLQKSFSIEMHKIP